jgi:hypothetical protein
MQPDFTPRFGGARPNVVCERSSFYVALWILIMGVKLTERLGYRCVIKIPYQKKEEKDLIKKLRVKFTIYN